MRVVLVGAGGQLGTDLTVALDRLVDLRPLTHADLDITDANQMAQAIAYHGPDLVINTAAYNRVEDCETQPDLALSINTSGPHLLAQACHRAGTALMHFSTDYVFSGDRTRPWDESDTPRPTSLYGISKLAGELAVRAACPASYVLRVSGLFGMRGSRGKGGNFVETMLRLQAEGRPIRVVDDQVLAPTSTLDLAEKVAELIRGEAPFGLYHVTAAGACSWYEFARAIFDLSGLPVDLGPQRTSALQSPARRPAYSVLANTVLKKLGFEQIRPWSEGLRDYLERRLESGRESAVGAVTCAFS